MSELKHFIAKHSPRMTETLRTFFAERRQAAQQHTPYLVQSIDVLEEFTLRGGKQIRPMLVLLGCLMTGTPVAPAVSEVAAAVELFHKHILNLDDMADRDELRNGGPTVWKKYQELFKDWKDSEHHARSFAEIDGTLLGSFAFELVRRAQLSAAQRLAVMEVMINQMYFETVAGWQIHYYQNQESLADAQEDEFLTGLDLVTSRYTFVGPLKIGTRVGKSVSPEISTALEQYGLAVGLAFQLTDDVLGLFGDPAQTGKAVGNDVREGKKTLLLQYAYRAAAESEKAFLTDVCGRELAAGELEKVQAIVKSTGALTSTEDKAQECIARAHKILDSLKNLNTEQHQAVEVLAELADFVGVRKV